MTVGIENRKQKRVVLRKEVTINGSLKVMGLDLSEGGLYVHTGRSFKTGSVVSVSLPLGPLPVTLKARVQHAQEGIGMGLMFLETPPAALAALRRFIHHLAEEPGSASRKKVLLVDDNAMNRRISKSKLVLDGFTVLEAGDGIEAIVALEREEINLVVLDLHMEKMDGFKVLSLIRQKPEWKDLPVLVLSAKSNPAEIERAMQLGATEFLVKMMTPPVKLCERVRLHLLTK